jgi:predicted porin
VNKTLLAIAVGAVFAIPSAAFADVKVYGKFNVGFDSQKDELGISSSNQNAASTNGNPVKAADSTWSLHDQNNSSRLGFKGDQDLGLGDLKAIFQLEYGIDPFGDDNGANKPFTERNIFLGLQGGFGTVKAGRFDTPVKVAGEKVDQFNDEAIGDDTNLMVGETRISNIIQYSTPKFGDLVTVNLAIVPGEGRTAVDNTNDVDKSVADTYYASVVFEKEMFFGTISYAGNEPASALKVDKGTAAGTTATAALDILRVAAGIKPISDLELAAMYQQATGVDQDNSATASKASDIKDTTYLLSAAYSISAFKIKAEYGQTKGDINDIKRTLMAFGVDYKLSKSFTTQLYYINYEDKDRTLTLSDTSTTPAGSKVIQDPKSTAFGLGVVYNF